ncbi:hypothetical protein ScPMuIL_009492 [Solemya velum]
MASTDRHLQMYHALPSEYRLDGCTSNDAVVDRFTNQPKQPDIIADSDSGNKGSGPQHCRRRKLQRQDALLSSEDFSVSQTGCSPMSPSRDDNSSYNRTGNGTVSGTENRTVPKTEDGAVLAISTSAEQIESARPDRDENILPSSTGSKEPDVLHTTNEFRKSEDDTLDVSSMKSLTCCAQSVGLIVANNSTGTCFRVGVRYIMTTNHLIKEMLAMFNARRIDIADWERCVFVRFDYTEISSRSPTIPLLTTPIFQNTNMDIVIMELKDCGIELPPPLHLDSFQTVDRVIHLIGHPGGRIMKIDPGCKVITLTQEILLEAKQWSFRFKGVDGYEGMDDSSMLLFHCSFQHGASGSPGLVIGPHKEPRVVTMLMKGYPSFYWELPHNIQSHIPTNFLVEQGIRMSIVRELMKGDHNLREIVKDIFKCETTSRSFLWRV